MERLPGVTQQGSGQAGPWSPGCLLKPTLLWTGAGPLPSPQPAGRRGLSGERCGGGAGGAGGVSAQSPVRGKRVVRSQSRQQWGVRPSWEAWCFILITQHAPGGAQRAAVLCRMYLSTWELKNWLLQCRPQDPQLGASQLPPGAREVPRASKKAGGEKTRSAAPCWESCSGILA